jgi:dephospho-CoA kinase
MPGLGKTVVAMERDDVLDFDTGLIRKHFMGYKLRGPKAWKTFEAFYPSLFEALNISKRTFKIILTNEPSFVKYLKKKHFSARFVLVVDYSADSWYKRIEDRDGADHEFAKALRKNKDNWYQGWLNDGNIYDEIIRLEQNKFLSDYID